LRHPLVFRFYVYGGIFDNPPGFLSARGTGCFLFFVLFSLFFLFECKQWGPHPPEGAQLTVRGGGFLLSRVLLLATLLVVYVFVVYNISLRDDGR
jgi:hypothetical protein